MHDNKAYLWVPSLYFVQGLPFALISIVIIILYKELNVSNETIPLYVSICGLPWILKPLWAPFLEIIASKRKWILAMQYVLALFILLAAASLSCKNFLFYSFVVFFGVAFFSATYDIATDGFYLLSLPAKQQAYYVGVRTLFYQLARLFCGGVLVMGVGILQNYYAAATAWQLGFSGLAAIFIIFALYHTKFLPHSEHTMPSTSSQQACRKNVYIFFDVFKAFFTLPQIKIFIVFLLLYNAAEAQLIRIVPLFLLDKAANGGLGFNTAQVGFWYGLCGSFAITLGAMLSGWFVGNLSLKRSLIPITVIVTIANCGYFLLTYFHADVFLVATVIIIAQFCFGLATSAYMIFLLQMCGSKQYKTSFYAISTAIMALGMMMFGAVSGYLQVLLTYTGFFVWIIVLNFIILLYTSYVSRKVVAQDGNLQNGFRIGY